MGPAWLGLIVPDPSSNPDLLGRIAEMALLVLLFTVGLRMEVPLLDRRWILSLRLAFVSMTITVWIIAVAEVWDWASRGGRGVVRRHPGTH